MLLRQNISDIVRQAESAYAIRVTAAMKAGYGSGNRNYILETEQGVFVLCVIEEQTADEVYSMARTLGWLADHGYPSSNLRQTAEQQLTTVIDGKPALLRRYLRGEVCWAPNEHQVSQVGAALATLHQIPCPGYLPTNIYYCQDRFAHAMNSGHDPAYEVWVKQSLERLNVEFFTDLPRGLIHADAFADNVLFDGEKLVAIIDFELACNYYLAFDLAMAIVGMCLKDNEPCSLRVKGLISGYETVRTLQACERRAIGPLAEYAAVMTSLWRYWRYRCHEPGHAKQNAYKDLATAGRHMRFFDWDA